MSFPTPLIQAYSGAGKHRDGDDLHYRLTAQRAVIVAYPDQIRT
jgi:hypothetical protein